MAQQQRQYAAIPEPTTDVAALLKTVAALKQNVEVLCGMRKAGAGIADQLTDLRSSTGRINARFTAYVQVSTGNNIALARRTTTLEADMYGQTGRITLLEEARVTAEDALAQRASTLETDMYGATGRVSVIEKSFSDANGALAERAAELEADMYQNSGRVSSVERASVGRDNALGEQIGEVSASVGAGFANGRIAFRASAGPAGYTASYDLTLTAEATGGSEALAGMSVLAKALPNGGSEGSIAFTANTFMLFDPQFGPIPVFRYANGLFTFNVPVEVRTGDIARRAITIPYFNRNGAGNGGGTATILITITDTDTLVDITADFDGQPLTSFPFQAADQKITLARVRTDGAHYATVQQKNIPFFISGNNENRAVSFLYVGMSAQDMPPEPGDYYYQVTTSHGYGPMTLKILAAKR